MREYNFKKGISGNPQGKLPGTTSLKVFAKNYLKGLSDEDKLDFLDALPPQIVWQMAEGNPENKSEVKINKDEQFTEEEVKAAKAFILNKINGGDKT